MSQDDELRSSLEIKHFMYKYEGPSLDPKHSHKIHVWWHTSVRSGRKKYVDPED